MIPYLNRKETRTRKGQICLLRADFNVKDVKKTPFKVKALLPTLKLLVNNSVKVVILSHRGRYGKDAKSLKPFAEILSHELRLPVKFLSNFNFSKLRKQIDLSPEKVILMENLRFLSAEEKNDKRFAVKLASLGDFYVNDAFAVAHRKNASVFYLPQKLPSYAGILIKREIKYLNKVMKHYQSPFTIIIGGVKAKTKIGLIKFFLNKADNFLIGGAVSNTFIAARGFPIGISKYEADILPQVKRIAALKKIILPVDFKIKERMILDIGERTISIFKDKIKKSKTIIWNGPMGFFEKKGFELGSTEIAKAIAESKAFSVVGGGETTELIDRLGILNRFGFVSTGGGAMLEYLAGKKLPALEVLKKLKK